MVEGFLNNAPVPTNEQLQVVRALDNEIADEIAGLEATGLSMERWNALYEALPNTVVAFEEFREKLRDFKEKRREALSSIEFSSDVSPQLKERCRTFDREVINAFGDQENFLGNGASAEVYGMRSNDALCIKFISNQERYNDNNHIRTEFEYLSRVYEHTKDAVVRVPYPVFVRIHPTEGHSYGMERIHGASLSQILENPERYPEVLEIAKAANWVKLEQDLIAFVEAMHSAGVVHGDLYKRNIMLGTDGRLFVIDFGKAKSIDLGNDREDSVKSDLYVARQSVRGFRDELQGIDNSNK